jgi:hypothetical protein
MITNMKDIEKENMDYMEKKNKQSMDEKIHYEIKFIENEEGYRLEASGDKEVLKRLGIGPNMVINLGPKRSRPTQGRRARRRRGMNRLHRRPVGTKRRLRSINDSSWASGSSQPGHEGPGFRSQRRFNQNQCHGRKGNRFNRRWGKSTSNPKGKGHREIWDC